MLVYLPRREEIAVGPTYKCSVTQFWKPKTLRKNRIETIKKFQCFMVGAAGFEPTTPSPPD